MRYLIVPLVILIVFIIAYLGQLNPGKVTLFLARDVSREFQITSLILFSAVIGAAFVIIGSGIR
ncbi:MAG TPA: hypothetical protein VFG95_04940, partial [Nitrospiria bacterium]|nr:hypothetical protein [Nitrospiria bacterium]